MRIMRVRLSFLLETKLLKLFKIIFINQSIETFIYRSLIQVNHNPNAKMKNTLTKERKYENLINS